MKRGGKKNPINAEVHLLQNGAVISEFHEPMSGSQKVRLSAHHKAELSVPFYPLSFDSTVLFNKHGHPVLCLDLPWEGFVTQSGQIQRISKTMSLPQEFPLKVGDFASLSYRDLRLLVRIHNEPLKARGNSLQKIDSTYSGSFQEIFFGNHYSPKSLSTALTCALSLWIAILFFAFFQLHDKPSSFDQLTDQYTLPFISEDHIRTAPEALQAQLDRRILIPQIVRYYDGLTSMYRGEAISFPGLLFDSSIKHYKSLHSRRNEKIETFKQENRQFAMQRLQSLSQGQLLIPVTTGESFTNQLLRFNQHLENYHQSLSETLELRKQTTPSFLLDSAYDYGEYRKNKFRSVFQQLEVEKQKSEYLKKIRSTIRMDDEDRMYFEVNQLADRSNKIRSRLQLQKTMGLDEVDQVRPIYTDIDLEKLGFALKDQMLKINEKMDNLKASEFGKKARASKEPTVPLTGRIDPSLLLSTIQKNQYHLQVCYEDALRQQENEKGTMKWKWQIDINGQVDYVTLVHSTIRDHNMIRCVKRRLQSWRFPKPEHGHVLVSHAFEFQKEQG